MPLHRRDKSRRARYKPYPMAEGGEAGIDEFVKSGRTGRRNALADILDHNHGNTSTAVLPATLEKLTCTEDCDASKDDKAAGSTSADGTTATADAKTTADGAAKTSDDTKTQLKKSS